MDLTFLYDYLVPVVVAMCLCVGYIIKYSLDFIPNKYIPAIMAVMGVIFNVCLVGGIDVLVVLGGMFSGLASTGLNEMFRNLINPGNKNK